MAAYKRILLKLSGEALMGDDAYGINRADDRAHRREIAEVHAARRARSRSSSAAATSSAAWRRRRGRHGPRDRRLHGHAGDGDERAGAAGRDAPATASTARVQSALDIEQVVEPYIRGRRRCATSRKARS